MRYTNIQTIQNQAFVAQSNKQKYISRPLSIPTDQNNRTSINPLECKELLEDPIGFIKDIHKNALLILNVVISEKQKRVMSGDKDVYVSQEFIAKSAGFKCRATSNRWLKKLCSWGILGKISRPYSTCVYFLNGLFLDEQFRYKLRDIFPSFLKIESQEFKRELAIRSFNGDGKSLPHGFFSSTVTLFNIEKRNIYIKPSLTKSLSIACKGWVGQEEKREKERREFDREIYSNLAALMAPDDTQYLVPTGGFGGSFSKKGKEKGRDMKDFGSLLEGILRNSAPREAYKGKDETLGSNGSDVSNQSYEIRYSEPPKTMAEAARRNRELIKRLGRG